MLEAFGVGRVMFGGDFPVHLLANTPYTDWVYLAVKALSKLSDDERQQIFYSNALKFYRL
jgi:L-fuconolactonase